MLSPPRYQPSPLFGMARHFAKDPLGTLLAAGAVGDVVRCVYPGARLVLAASPGAVHHVLVGNARNYTKDARTYHILSVPLGMGLVTSEGELWKKQRRTMQPAFHRQRVTRFSETMVRVAEETLERWRVRPGAGPLDLHREMRELTLAIICRTLLSIELRDQVEAIGTAFECVIERLSQRLVNPLLPPRWVPTRGNRNFDQALRVLDDVVNRSIAEHHRQEPSETGDLLDLLMAARDEDSGDGMSDRQLRDEVMTLFIAGHETTANGLTWALYLLGQHPEVMGAVQRELEEVLQGRSPALADLPRLELLDRVVKEALRLYPPVWLVERAAVADDVIEGVQIRAGDVLMVSPWVTHRRPGLWEAPEKFDPDRFLPANEAARPRNAYFPFILGTRKCIGDMFASTELRLVLATLLARARYELARPVQPEAVVTLRPRTGLWVNLLTPTRAT